MFYLIYAHLEVLLQTRDDGLCVIALETWLETLKEDEIVYFSSSYTIIIRQEIISCYVALTGTAVKHYHLQK